MTEGIVKFYSIKKHFGFIIGDDGKDYFVHSSSLGQGVFVEEGDKVTFDIFEDETGLKAQNVNKLGEADSQPTEETPQEEPVESQSEKSVEQEKE
jgi:cold shock protein